MQKKYRLAKREHFSQVFRFGQSVANYQFVLYSRKNANIEEFRLGVSVSKKLGNAVVRNKLRRRMKEIVRHHREQIAGGYDLILIARKPVADMTYQQMEKSVLHIIRKASLWKPKKR
ncbi:ribonuclease P protein component [Marinicrinis sediminis]|uniref:Ribonuclease P protein component n=1 Tax=Marinicrinis sediminis TaxID=1652465 RepID=A0ABW5RBP1_9BACL